MDSSKPPKKKLKANGEEDEEDDDEDDDDEDEDEEDDDVDEVEKGLSIENSKNIPLGFIPKENEHITIISSDTREQDRYLPVANIARIMKTVLPGNAKARISRQVSYLLSMIICRLPKMLRKQFKNVFLSLLVLLQVKQVINVSKRSGKRYSELIFSTIIVYHYCSDKRR